MVNDDLRIKEAVAADLGVAPNHTVRSDSGAIPDDRTGLDHGVRVDPDPLAEGDPLPDNRCGMHL